MDDAGRGMNEIDRALAAALDVTPSPDFVARVRQRISREPRPLPFWHRWRIALPALAAAGLVAIGLAVMSRPSPAVPQLLQARTLPGVDLRPRVADPPGAVVVPTPGGLATTARVERTGRRVQAEPEVLVPREEIEMYRRLIAAAQAVPHAVIVESPKDIVSVGEIADIAIDPIKIAPIAAPPSGSQGERQ